jgi:hypothetical protein
MIQIPLQKASTSRTLVFDPDKTPWKKQAAEFVVGFQTGLPGPFDRVFIKRLPARAQAHDLLSNIRGKDTPGIPCFFGYRENSSRHYYVSENLPNTFKTAEQWLSDIPSELISVAFISAVVKQAILTFKILWKKEYIYTDFCAKNIMRDSGNSIYLSDIDSCWSLTRLAGKRHRRPNGIEFDIKFWDLWNTHVAVAAPGGEERAPPALVIAFAAVWLRALALKRSGHAAAAEALVKDPSATRQRPLWDALAAHNQQKFAGYFSIANPSPAYVQWQSLFDALREGRAPSWTDIRKGLHELTTAIEAKTAMVTVTVSLPSRMGQSTSPPEVQPGDEPLRVEAKALEQSLEPLYTGDAATFVGGLGSDNQLQRVREFRGKILDLDLRKRQDAVAGRNLLVRFVGHLAATVGAALAEADVDVADGLLQIGKELCENNGLGSDQGATAAAQSVADRQQALDRLVSAGDTCFFCGQPANNKEHNITVTAKRPVNSPSALPIRERFRIIMARCGKCASNHHFGWAVLVCGIVFLTWMLSSWLAHRITAQPDSSFWWIFWGTLALVWSCRRRVTFLFFQVWGEATAAGRKHRMQTREHGACRRLASKGWKFEWPY